MLGFEFIGTIRSDCFGTRDITTYITMDHPYTVKEFVNDVLRQFPNHWGLYSVVQTRRNLGR